MKQENILEDIKLWKRLINDERDALSMLFRKYYKPLLNYGLHLIPRDDLVKDSIQELFLQCGIKEKVYLMFSMLDPIFIVQCAELFLGRQKGSGREEREIELIRKKIFMQVN